MFGGDDTPAGMFNRNDETEKVHRCCSSQSRASVSRSNNTPEGDNEQWCLCASASVMTLTNGHPPSGQHLFVQEQIRVFLQQIYLVVLIVRNPVHCAELSAMQLPFFCKAAREGE